MKLFPELSTQTKQGICRQIPQHSKRLEVNQPALYTGKPSEEEISSNTTQRGEGQSGGELFRRAALIKFEIIDKTISHWMLVGCMTLEES